MRLTKNQRNKIIANLDALWRQNWEAPQEAIVEALKQAMSIVTPEVDARLRKFGLAPSVSEKVRIEDDFLYNQELSYTLDPVYCAHVETSPAFGKCGYRGKLSCAYNGGDNYTSEISGMRVVICAVTGNNNYDSLERLIDVAETNSGLIIDLKKRLENPPEKLFEFLASLPGKFAALVQKRLEKCDEIESENLSRLLDEFGLKPKSKRRKHTVFKVNIVKEEVED